MFIEIFPTGPLETNAILVACLTTKKAAVFDPAKNSCHALLEKIEEMGFSLEKILLTHSHWDHFADLKTLKEKTSAPTYVHKLDAQNVESPGSDGLPLFFEIEGVSPDHFLKEGDEVKVGEISFQVIETPGHSPGGVCFYSKKENLLISGDTLFAGTYGRLDLPTGEENAMLLSLKKLSRLPQNTRVIPGHGPETTLGRETWLKEI